MDILTSFTDHPQRSFVVAFVAGLIFCAVAVDKLFNCNYNLNKLFKFNKHSFSALESTQFKQCFWTLLDLSDRPISLIFLIIF